MQNTTNQSQNFYTKPRMPSPAPKVDETNQTPNKKMAMNKKPKRMFAVAGLVLFLIVAVMGVLIAQKQVSTPGEDVSLVAPNAPESQPDASTYEPNNCSTLFYVSGPDGYCDTKKAYTDYTNNIIVEEIPSGSSFNVGEVFVFQIKIVQRENGLAEDIEVTDVLPDSLTFVEGFDSSEYTVTNNGQNVTATIPSMEKDEVINVEFKVRVNSSNYGSHVNTAFITDSEIIAEAGACRYSFKTLKGITECVSKEMFDLDGQLISDGGALTRGEEYEYRVTVKATNLSAGEVKIHDMLPEELEYIRPAAGSAQYITNDPSSGLLIANFGVLEDEEMTLGFIMKVPENIEPTKFENLAKVYAFPVGSRQVEPSPNADECSVGNVILPIGTAKCLHKEAFHTNGTEIASGSEIEPGQTFTYRVTVLAEQTTSGPVVLVDQLPAGLEYIQDSGNTPGITESPTGTLTIDLETMQSGEEEVVEFMVQLVANPTDETFNNVAVVTTDDDTEHSCELSLELKKEYSCNSECDTDAQCNEIGSDHICYTTDNGDKFCRLEDFEEELDCEEPESTPTPTPPALGCNDLCVENADCSNSDHICITTSDGSNRCRLDDYPSSSNCTNATPTPTPTPTPSIGCNDLCTQNADCVNIDHICVTVGEDTEGESINKCRLADYINSDTCSEPVVATPTTQPVLPTELPQSGPAEWLNWLKAGLVTLGIGTALFLLL